VSSGSLDKVEPFGNLQFVMVSKIIGKSFDEVSGGDILHGVEIFSQSRTFPLLISSKDLPTILEKTTNCKFPNGSTLSKPPLDTN